MTHKLMMMKKLLRKNLLMPGLDLDSSSFMCFSLLLLIDLPDKGSKARSHFETFTLCLVFLLSENADQDEQCRTCAEEKAGYYECQECNHRYVPTYWQTNLAMHVGRTRYMKCPKCGKYSWQKKVLTAVEED